MLLTKNAVNDLYDATLLDLSFWISDVLNDVFVSDLPGLVGLPVHSSHSEVHSAHCELLLLLVIVVVVVVVVTLRICCRQLAFCSCMKCMMLAVSSSDLSFIRQTALAFMPSLICMLAWSLENTRRSTLNNILGSFFVISC